MIWEAAVRLFNDLRLLPAAALAIARPSSSSGTPLYRIRCHTLWTTMVGFALAVVFGLLLGLAVGWSRAIYAGIYPLMIGFNAIPKVAVVPILVLWFGIGLVPAVLTAFLISFFPIVVNVATGLATIEPELEDVLQGARRIQARHHAQGRHPALAAVFLRLAEGGDHARLCRLGDFRKHRLELRHRQPDAAGQAEFQVPLMFAGLIALAVLGIIIYAAMAVLERRTTGWAQRSNFAAG